MKRLQLGCGEKYKEGWINLDISKEDIYGNKIKVDVAHNLNNYPYPFKSEEFDYILISHTLEHLENIKETINELLRITKKEGVIEIIVPYFSHYASFRDPTHKIRFTMDTITYYKGFEILSKELNISHNKFMRKIFNTIINLNYKVYERFFCYILPAEECIWRISPIK